VKFSRQKSARSLLKIYLSKRGEREENQDRSVAFESTFQKGFILGFRPMQEKALSWKTACFAEADVVPLVCRNKRERRKEAREKGPRKRRVIKRARESYYQRRPLNF
jgi:hypothetical protein